MEQIEQTAPIQSVKKKKPLKILGIVVMALIAAILLGFFAKQCYVNYVFNHKTEVEWESVPKWLIYGGQKRYDEIYNMGMGHITKSLESKYADATKIEIKDLHVMLTGGQQTVDCVEFQNSEYFHQDIFTHLSTRSWLEYSGVVLAECNIDGKDFIAYVDLHSEDWYVYDNYQRDEIYAAVTEYFDNLVDEKPICSLIYIKDYDVAWYRIGVEYEECFDIEGACYNYFDGDVEKFLTNNEVINQINITMIYNTDQKLPITEEFIKDIGKDYVSIYRIADKEIAQKFADDEVEIYDIWEDVDECYISRGKQSQYGFGWIWEHRDYGWTPKSDVNAESSIGQH